MPSVSWMMSTKKKEKCRQVCIQSDNMLRLHPFDNQPPKVLGRLIEALLNLANESGKSELDELPDVTRKQINGPLPPAPQPEAKELDRLFELQVEDPSENQEEEEELF